MIVGIVLCKRTIEERGGCEIAVFRVGKTKDFTVMSNHHLHNTELSLKAKGLLSLMLSLPEDWDYTTKDIIAGKATSQIARELNTEGISTSLEYKNITRRYQNAAYPRKPLWIYQWILEMLGNMKYIGYMVNNTRESRFIRDKVQRRTRREEWIINENTHEAIVSQEEFDAVQAMLRCNLMFKFKKNTTQIFPFYCAHCGRKLGKTTGFDVHFYCVASYWSEGEIDRQKVRWDKWI